MSYIATSGDLLNIIIAAAVLAFTVFLCWGIFYGVMILRQAFKMIKEMRERVNKVDEAIKAFKEKIEHSTSYLLLISEGVKKLVEVMRDKGEKWRKRKEQ